MDSSEKSRRNCGLARRHLQSTALPAAGLARPAADAAVRYPRTNPNPPPSPPWTGGGGSGGAGGDRAPPRPPSWKP